MATAVARMTAVFDALIDGTATTAFKTSTGDNFAKVYRQEIIDLGHDPDNLTSEQKAANMIRVFKRSIRGVNIRRGYRSGGSRNRKGNRYFGRRDRPTGRGHRMTLDELTFALLTMSAHAKISNTKEARHQAS